MAGIVFMAPTMLCCFRTHRKSRADRYKVDESEDHKEEAGKKAHDEQPQFSWDKREAVDMQRYLIRDLRQMTHVRPRSGKDPLQIENCEDANLLILSSTSSVTIDDCKHCFIVIGPCAGSVFLRDCSDCTIMCVCQQLRTRDCFRVQLALHCTTQPIIESSAQMAFHPLIINYPEFKEEMAAAGLSAFSQRSQSVHDFTPSRDGSKNHHIHSEPLQFTKNQIDCLIENNITINSKESAIPLLYKVEQHNADKHHTFSAIQKGETESEFVDRCADFGKLITMTPSLKLAATHDVSVAQDELPFLANGRIISFEIVGKEAEIEQLLAETELGFALLPEQQQTAFDNFFLAKEKLNE